MNLIKSIKNLTGFEKCLWIGSLLLIAISFLAAGKTDWLTLIVSLIGATSLIFISKGDAMGQVLMVAFSILYAVVSFRYRYFGEMITYLGMTLPTAVVTLVQWIKHPYKEREVAVAPMTRKKWIGVFVFAGVSTLVFYFILDACNTNSMFFSTISITTSFLGASLIVLRSPYYAVGYGANDIVLVVLWILACRMDISSLPMVICFATFFVNDAYGFVSWRRMAVRQEQGL